jgi:hypothetical protein
LKEKMNKTKFKNFMDFLVQITWIS